MLGCLQRFSLGRIFLAFSLPQQTLGSFTENDCEAPHQPHDQQILHREVRISLTSPTKLAERRVNERRVGVVTSRCTQTPKSGKCARKSSGPLPENTDPIPAVRTTETPRTCKTRKSGACRNTCVSCDSLPTGRNAHSCPSIMPFAMRRSSCRKPVSSERIALGPPTRWPEESWSHRSAKSERRVAVVDVPCSLRRQRARPSKLSRQLLRRMRPSGSRTDLT